MEQPDPRTATEGASPGRLLKRRASEMSRGYPKALVGDVEAVHDLRVAARRLRTAVALLADKPEGRRARRADKALRDLARAAGRGRDLDVGLEILEGMPRGLDEGTAKLRRSLQSARARARYLSREALLDLDVAHLRRDLRALEASTQLTREEFASRHEALLCRQQESIAADLALARGGRDGDALHGVRRAARRLRYAAELAGMVGAANAEAAGRWRKMQTALGKIQDRRVLADWLASRVRLAASRRDPLLEAAASRALIRVRRDGARLTRAFFSAPTLRSAGPTPPPGHPV
jgi:CHAD domain-containing protein